MTHKLTRKKKRYHTNFNTRKGFPYGNPFAHIIGGLNVSGWFSLVKCKTNVFSYFMACRIGDS